MSDSFMIASRLELPRGAFDRWMSAPVGRTDVIANPDDMYVGWSWQDRVTTRADWSASETDSTPAEVLASRIEVGPPALTLARHSDGAAEIYLFDLGYEPMWMRQYLLMLAGAAAYLDSGPDRPALLWPDPSGRLWAAPGSTLALLMVGPSGARFAGRRDLDEITAALAPADRAFAEMVDRIADGENAETVHRDPEHVDPAILALVDGGTDA